MAQEASPSPVRDRILAAARKRFEAFGYRRTGVAEIAREAGVAGGTLYRYFKNKEDIFVAVVEQMLAAWVAEADKILRSPGTVVERLAQLGLASVEYNQKNLLFNAILARDEEIAFAPLLDSMNERLRTQNVERMAEMIRDGIRQGEIRALDPELTAYVLWLGGNALFNQKVYPYRVLLPLYGDMLLRGILQDMRPR